MVDISMTDCSLSLLYLPFAAYFANAASPQRGAEGLSGRYACYQVYETVDGRFLSLGALEPKFWQNACRVFDREDLIPLQFSNSRQQEVIDSLKEIFRTRTANEWLTAFEGVDTCLTLIKDIAEMIDDPQIKHRGLFAEIENPAGNSFKQIAPVIKLSATPGEMQSPPPPLGAHTHQLLATLGYTDEQIDCLRRDEVV
jgi:crotonobetainyl-CoA:carnitine CoA-transferase CaiB-like acyl-CoA transferase